MKQITSEIVAQCGIAALHGSISDVADVVREFPAIVRLPTDHVGHTLLHQAAIGCHRSLAEFLVAAGASVEATDSGGYQPLHYAAQQGCVDLVSFLLDQGANLEAVTSSGLTPIHCASIAGTNTRTAEVVRLLLQRGARIDLNSAVALGRIARAQAIIRAEPAQIRACRAPGRLLYDATELRQAGRLIRSLIEAGVDPDSRGPRGMTALHRAVELGKPGIVKLLLDSGAALNARTQAGDTPFSLAVANGDSLTGQTIINVLLRRGAILDLNSALRLGRSSEALEMLERNINAIADSPSRNNILRNAIIYAQSPEIVSRLLERGVDVNQPDSGGYYPLFRAIEQDPQLAILLLNYGARTEIIAPDGRALLDVARQQASHDPDSYSELLRRLQSPQSAE